MIQMTKRNNHVIFLKTYIYIFVWITHYLLSNIFFRDFYVWICWDYPLRKTARDIHRYVRNLGDYLSRNDGKFRKFPTNQMVPETPEIYRSLTYVCGNELDLGEIKSSANKSHLTVSHTFATTTENVITPENMML